MFLFESCKKSTVLFGESIGQQALISGVSDVIVIKWPNGEYRSTPFLVCFGSHSILNREASIKILINDQTTIQTKTRVNRHGYMNHVYMTQERIEEMKLNFGMNKIKYILEDCQIQAQLWLIKITDKILISDFDGTLTVNDLSGLLGGIFDFQAVHLGYAELIKKLYERGIVMIWVTMRSLPFYKMSKEYLDKYLGVSGIMLMEPEQFLPAVKKQLFRKTCNIKANIIKMISQLYPKGVYPFVGGLGNRENDAIAYLNIGIKMENIFLVNSQSKVHQMSSKKLDLTYTKMANNIDHYFNLNTYFF